MLTKRLWKDHGIHSRLRSQLTKSLYSQRCCVAVSPGHLIVDILQSSINFICDVSVKLHISNGRTWYQTLLECSQINGIEAYLLAAQCRWTRHVIQMDNHRIPKRSPLTQGSRSCGGQYKRFKASLRANLKSCGIPFAKLESRTSNRTTWRSTFRSKATGHAN